MSIATDIEIDTRLWDKLDPRRFTAMSPKMAALVACILKHGLVGAAFDTEPALAGLYQTSDGVLTRDEGDIGANEFIGSRSDFDRNLRNLVVAAGLDGIEAARLARLTALAFEN